MRKILTTEFYELHEMLKLEITVEEGAENGRDVITFAHSGTVTEKETQYGDEIRAQVVEIARKRKAATKYVKTPTPAMPRLEEMPGQSLLPSTVPKARPSR